MIREKNKQILFFLFGGFYLFESIDVFNGTLRLISGLGETYDSILNLYVMLTRPLLLALYAFCIYRLGPPERRPIYILMYAAPFALGLLVGIGRGNDLYPILVDISNLSVGLLVLILSIRIFSEFSLGEVLEVIDHYLRWWIYPLCIAFAAFLILKAAGLIVYPGYSPGNLGFATIYWTLTGKKKSAWLGWLIILFSGRRGLLIGLMIPIAISYLISNFNRQKLWIATGALTLAIVVGLISIATFSFDSVKNSEITTLQKFGSLDPRSYNLKDPKELNTYLSVASAGRWNEIAGVIEAISADPTILLLGKGLGATYHVDYFDPENPAYPEGKHRNVHFSYVALVLLFGLLLPSSFIFLVGRSTLRILTIVDVDPKLNSIAATTLFASLLMCMSGFNFFQDFFMWFFIGYGLTLLPPRALARESILA